MNNDSQKQVLKTAITAMVIIGICAMGYVFISALSPSVSANAARSSHDVSSLNPGDYLFEKHDGNNTMEEKILIIKDWDSSLYVYLIPIINRRIPLPENFWGQAANGKYCTDFGPELNDSNKILKSGVIKCHDKPVKDHSHENWKWSYKGVSKTSWIAGLIKPKYEVVDNLIYINQ